MPSDMNISHSTYPGVVAEPALDPAKLATLAKAELPRKDRAAVTTERVSAASAECGASSEIDLDPPQHVGEIDASQVLEVLYRVQVELRKDHAECRWVARDREMKLLSKQATEIRDGAWKALWCAMGASAAQVAGFAVAAGGAIKSMKTTSAGIEPQQTEVAKNISDCKTSVADLQKQSTVLNNDLAKVNTKLESDFGRLPANRTELVSQKEALTQQKAEIDSALEMKDRVLSGLEAKQGQIEMQDYTDRTQRMFAYSQLGIQGGQSIGQGINAGGEFASKNAQADAVNAESDAKAESYQRQEQEELYQNANKAMEDVRNILGQIISAEAKTIERINS